MKVETARSICDTLADYRNGEIRKRTAQDVERWLNQFNATDRPVVLAETDRLLKCCYVSQERAEEFIRAIWKTTSIFGKDVKSSVKTFKFLDIQKKGSSQRTMLAVADKSLKTHFGVSIKECGHDPTGYVYLDDCTHSGSTVVHDLDAVVNTLKPGTVLHMVFLARHSGAVRYIQKALGPKLEARQVKHSLWSIGTYENLPWAPDDHELLWPCEVVGDALVDRYVARVRALCEGKTFEPRIFRPSLRTNEDIFSSPEARQVLECALLRKGAYIIAQCQAPQPSMRPLGYEYLSSLGFGATVVTYRNIPNNCPLALWWGDPTAPAYNPLSRWYPLIPRRRN